MSGSVNKVILVGNVGRDPEMRTTNDGRRIANLSLATSDTWRDKNSGERKERTEWHRIVVFNEPLADIVEKYVRKGSKIYIEGALQTRKWTDQQGHERYSTEVVLQVYRGQIVLLDSAGSSNRPPPADGADDYGNEHTYGGGDTGGYSARHDNPGAVRGNVADRMGMPPTSRVGTDIDDEIPF